MYSIVMWMALVAAPRPASAQDGCPVPKDMTKEQKRPCVRAGVFLLDQPTLTLEQLTKGPDFDAADPTGSRFAYFTEADVMTCYFRPHYAFKRVKGQSLKFQCWQLDAARHFFGRKGESLDTGEVKIVLEKNSGGEQRSHLYARSDETQANEIRADRVKVKYLKPPHPNHNRRYHEVFTEIAASRFLWALGFPADHEYPVQRAACVGCTADPFADNLKKNEASIGDTTVPFDIATVGREKPWDEIDPQNDETWSWRDAASFYRGGQWTRQQQVQYDAYRLALGLFTYHNAIDVQNRLACAAWKPDASNPKVCVQPMVFVQDLGSSFGKDGFFTNPRGSFKDWRTQTVFKKLETCELRHALEGERRPLKEAQDLLIQRLQTLDRERVKTIFTVARFHLMDQDQLKRLRESGVPDVSAAALNEWTDTFMSRINEIRTAQNCRP